MVGHRPAPVHGVGAERRQHPAQADSHVGIQRQVGVLAFEHGRLLFGRQHPLARRIAPVGELHHQKAAEIGDAGIEPAGRHVTQGGLALRLALVVAARHPDVLRHGGTELRVAQAKRGEHGPLQVLLERLAGGGLDHRADQVEADVRIHQHLPRRGVDLVVDQRMKHRAKVMRWRGRLRQPHAAGDVAQKAGMVRHQLSQRDVPRLRPCAADAKP